MQLNDIKKRLDSKDPCLPTHMVTSRAESPMLGREQRKGFFLRGLGLLEDTEKTGKRGGATARPRSRSDVI